MAKRSGFQVTVRAFIAAEAFDAGSLTRARAAIEQVHVLLGNNGFVNIEVEQKPRHRVEVGEEPTRTITNIGDGPVTTTVIRSDNLPPGALVTPTVHPVGVPDDPLALPPHLDRRAKA